MPPALPLERHTPATLHDVLGHYPLDTLARWMCELNCFRWPAGCPIAAPRGFAEASDREKMRLAGVLWHYFKTHIPPSAVSRAWWVYHLGRTEEAWACYWEHEHGPVVDEMRKAWANTA